MRKILGFQAQDKRHEFLAKILILVLLAALTFMVTSCQSDSNPNGTDEQSVSSEGESETLVEGEPTVPPDPASTPTATPTLAGVGGTNPIGRDDIMTSPTPSNTPDTTITPTPTSTFENIPVGPAGNEASVPELISPNDISGFSQIHNTVIGLPSNLEPVHILSWVDGNELALGFAFRNNSSDSYLVDLAYTITPYDSSGSELTDLLNFTTPLAERQYAVKDLGPGESIDFWQVVQLSGPVASLDSIEINFVGEALPRFQTELLPLEILATPTSYFEINNINSSNYSRGEENFLKTEFALFNPNTSSITVSLQFTAFDTAGNVLVAVDTSYQHNLALFDSAGIPIQNNQIIIPPRESISYVLTTFIEEPELLGAVDFAIVSGDLIPGVIYQPDQGNPAIKFYADTIDLAQEGTAVSINAILQSKGDTACDDYRLNIYAFAFNQAGVVIDSGSVTLNTASSGFEIASFTIPFTATEPIEEIYLFQEVNRFETDDPALCFPSTGPNPIGRDSIPMEWSINTVMD